MQGLIDILRRLFGRHGSSIIANAIAGFESTIAQLERGIALNEQRCKQINDTVLALVNESSGLSMDSSRASNVVTKIRGLIN